MGLTLYVEYSSHSSWMWGIFHILLSLPKNNAMGLNNVMPDHGLLDYCDLVGVCNPCRAFAHPLWMPHFKYVQIKYEVSELCGSFKTNALHLHGIIKYWVMFIQTTFFHFGFHCWENRLPGFSELQFLLLSISMIIVLNWSVDLNLESFDTYVEVLT